MQIEILAISQIKPNPINPRQIKAPSFLKLVESLRAFPEMATVRPIVVNEKLEVLGGNMRLRAAKEAGWQTVPVHVVDWSEEKQREFIIKDNVGFGEWDFDMLANEWETEQLSDWGLDVPGFDSAAIDYSEKNAEIDVDNLAGQMTIKLNYSEDDYWKVKERLASIAETPEAAIWKLLGNE